MKKIYQSPKTIFVKVINAQHLLGASQGGIATGGTPGDEYTNTDVSFGRSSGLWDDED